MVGIFFCGVMGELRRGIKIMMGDLKYSAQLATVFRAMGGREQSSILVCRVSMLEQG
jgi:hypothetical protein